MMEMCSAFLSSIPVLFVIALLSWAYYVFIFIFCPIVYFDLSSGGAIVNALMFNVILCLLMYSYCICVRTDPGSPPRRSEDQNLQQEQEHLFNKDLPENLSIAQGPDDRMEPPQTPVSDSLIEYSEDQMTMITSKRNGQPRQCRKCHNQTKPDRTHHCSICKRCVLRMDHHCPWIKNCVGFHNHKFFILFLLYTCLLCYFILSTLWIYSHGSGAGNMHQLAQWDIQIFLLGAVALCFGLALTAFSAMHVAQILRNTTTIESFERHRYRNVDIYLSGLATGRKRYVNVFDLGWRENWRQVMGRRWFEWMLPVNWSPGDGCSFPYNSDALRQLTRIQVEENV